MGCACLDFSGSTAVPESAINYFISTTYYI